MNYTFKSDRSEIYYEPDKGILRSVRGTEKAIRFKPIPDNHNALRHFYPECLTIFSGHSCNLSCRYCYAGENAETDSSLISMDALAAAIDYIADACTSAGKPFVIGFHGSTEPLMHPEHLERYLSLARKAVNKRSGAVRPFCTTNGVISLQTAQWALQNFSGITVSCDGPPRFHDHYRRKKNGDPTSTEVENTIRTFSAAPHLYLRIRSTITKTNVQAMADIVEYLAGLGVKNLEMFPVYKSNSLLIGSALQPEPADFVFEFLRAQRSASVYGVKLTCSAVRWPEPHGRFCYPLQKNLVITPDGFISACFLTTRYTEDATIIGAMDLAPSLDAFDHFMGRVNEMPHQCESCFNRHHCSMGCPEICPWRYDPSAPFNCDWLKWLGMAHLLQAVGIELPLDTPARLQNYFREWSVHTAGN